MVCSGIADRAEKSNAAMKTRVSSKYYYVRVEGVLLEVSVPIYMKRVRVKQSIEILTSRMRLVERMANKKKKS